jgi:hypothetical protein
MTNEEILDQPNTWKSAPPTAEAIGNLAQEALENATSQFLHDQIAKGGRRHA